MGAFLLPASNFLISTACVAPCTSANAAAFQKMFKNVSFPFCAIGN